MSYHIIWSRFNIFHNISKDYLVTSHAHSAFLSNQHDQGLDYD